MRRIILIALIFSIAHLIQAKGDGESRTTTVNVEISNTDLIDIQAKYTGLTVETWDKSEVEIEASVRYDGKITDKIQEFLDDFENRVNNNINLMGGELSIETDLDLPNKIQIGSKNVGINISYGDELKVFYQIKSPSTNHYRISTSYEDVRLIGDFDEVEFKQYSGDLKAGSIKTAKMDLKYGSAEIESLGNADLKMYEQKFRTGNIEDLLIDAKYSEVYIKSAGNIESKSYESDYTFGSIEILNGDYKYGEINITDKLDKAELTLYEVDIEARLVDEMKLIDTKYSKFDIDQINTIDFNQSYEDETNIGKLNTFKSINSKYGNHTIDQLNSTLKINAYEDEIEINQIGPAAKSISIEGKYIDASIATGGASFNLSSNSKYGKVSYDESLVDIKRYIKDGDQLEIEAQSKKMNEQSVLISIKGYEMKVALK